MKKILCIAVCISFLFSNCEKEEKSTLDVLQNGIWKEKDHPIFNRTLKFNVDELLLFKQGAVDTFFYSLNESEDTLIMIHKNSQNQVESRNHFYIENENKLTVYNLSANPPFQTSQDVFYKEN